MEGKNWKKRQCYLFLARGFSQRKRKKNVPRHGLKLYQGESRKKEEALLRLGLETDILTYKN